MIGDVNGVIELRDFLNVFLIGDIKNCLYVNGLVIRVKKMMLGGVYILVWGFWEDERELVVGFRLRVRLYWNKKERVDSGCKCSRFVF